MTVWNISSHLESEPESAGTDDGDELGLLAEVETLIADLENAKVGSVALDKRIQYSFRVTDGQSPDLAALVIAEGVSWPTVKETVEAQLPPFTTSLDACDFGSPTIMVLMPNRADVSRSGTVSAV